MEITFTLEREDLWAMTRYVYWHVPRYRRSIILNAIMIPLALLIMTRALFPNFALNLVVALLAGAFLLGSMYWAVRRGVMSKPTRQQGELTITISPDGVHTQTAVNEGLYHWGGIQEITEDKQHIYLLIDTNMGHIIPKRAFKNESEAQVFLGKAMEYKHASAN